MYFDTLVWFIGGYRNDIQDWLFVLLTRLLAKLGQDNLASVQSKLYRVLAVVREAYPYQVQFDVITRQLTDASLGVASMRLKQATLSFMLELIPLMDSAMFMNTSDHRQLVNKLIMMQMEKRSQDLCRVSQDIFFYSTEYGV